MTVTTLKAGGLARGGLFLWAVIALLTAPPAAHAQGHDKGNALVGSQLYGAYCLVCHGENGRAKGPLASKLSLEPADLSVARYQEVDRDELVQIIAGYKRQTEDATRMPNWGVALSEEDLYDLAAYVQRLNDRSLSLRGDTRRGRLIYQRACAACHGRFGGGDGLLAGLLGVKMIDFGNKIEMDKLNDTDLIEAIREGGPKSMPPWRGVLGEHEIEDVAAYVRLLVR